MLNTSRSEEKCSILRIQGQNLEFMNTPPCIQEKRISRSRSAGGRKGGPRQGDKEAPASMLPTFHQADHDHPRGRPCGPAAAAAAAWTAAGRASPRRRQWRRPQGCDEAKALPALAHAPRRLRPPRVLPRGAPAPHQAHQGGWRAGGGLKEPGRSSGRATRTRTRTTRTTRRT